MTVKELNRNRIFRLIYDSRGCSRQDIADELKLSLPTVNQNLKDLTDMGLIAFLGEFVSTGGRKPQIIVAAKDAFYTVALNIRKTYVRLVLVDFLGEVVDSSKTSLEFVDSDEYSKKLGTLTDEFIKKCNISPEKILGVGITIPGIFDRESEKIVVAPTLNIKDYCINKLTRHIKYNSIVVNDARASAFTYLHKTDNMDYGVYLLADRGVGGCIIENGSIVRGINNRAGEIGHMTIVPDGRECACGKRGCLESYISTQTLPMNSEGDISEITDDYLDMLSLGIGNISMIFDGPIVIGGGLALLIEPFIDEILKKISLMNPLIPDGPDIRIDVNSKKEALTGAALMLIEDYILKI
ncbi:MAG: ROK family protein [Lachnospiraceae bacterium]